MKKLIILFFVFIHTLSYGMISAIKPDSLIDLITKKKINPITVVQKNGDSIIIDLLVI